MRRIELVGKVQSDTTRNKNNISILFRCWILISFDSRQAGITRTPALARCSCCTRCPIRKTFHCTFSWLKIFSLYALYNKDLSFSGYHILPYPHPRSWPEVPTKKGYFVNTRYWSLLACFYQFHWPYTCRTSYFAPLYSLRVFSTLSVELPCYLHNRVDWVGDRESGKSINHLGSRVSTLLSTYRKVN